MSWAKKRHFSPAEVGSAAVRHRAFHVLPARVSIQGVRCWNPQILLITYEYLWIGSTYSKMFNAFNFCVLHVQHGRIISAKWFAPKFFRISEFPSLLDSLTVLFHHYSIILHHFGCRWTETCKKQRLEKRLQTITLYIPLHPFTYRSPICPRLKLPRVLRSPWLSVVLVVFCGCVVFFRHGLHDRTPWSCRGVATQLPPSDDGGVSWAKIDESHRKSSYIHLGHIMAMVILGNHTWDITLFPLSCNIVVQFPLQEWFTIGVFPLLLTIYWREILLATYY